MNRAPASRKADRAGQPYQAAGGWPKGRGVATPRPPQKRLGQHVVLPQPAEWG